MQTKFAYRGIGRPVRKSALLELCAALAGLAACSPDFVQIKSEHIVYEYNSALQPCAGTVAYMDRVVPFIASQFAREPPDRIRFSWYEPGDSGGLFNAETKEIGQHAWAAEPFHVHELTHAVLGAPSARFFAEGAAAAVEYASSAGYPRYPLSDEDLVRDVWNPWGTLLSKTSNDVNYGSAGTFVSYLFVLYGPDKFSDFYRGLSGPVTKSWLRSQFRRVYGRELDDEITSFRAAIPPCGEKVYPLNPHECSGPRVAWSQPAHFEYTVSMSCDDLGVVGGLGPEKAWPSFHAVTMHVPVGGTYDLAFDSSDVSVILGPCFGCPWQPREVVLEDVQSMSVDLEPGLHYLRINSDSDESPQVTVRLTPM